MGRFERGLLALIVAVPLVLPAAYSGYHWWIHTEGVERYAAITAVFALEGMLFYAVVVALRALRAGNGWRALFLALLTPVLALGSAVMLYPPVSHLVSQRFAPPEAANLAELEARQSIAEARVVSAAGLLRGSGADPDAVQSELISLGCALGGFDGRLGPATFNCIADVRTRAEADVARLAGEISIAEQQGEARTTWERAVVAAIGVILLLQICSRWAFLGVSHAPQPPAKREPETADAGQQPDEETAPANDTASAEVIPLRKETFTFWEFQGLQAKGKVPQPPPGKIWKVEPPNNYRPDGRVYASAIPTAQAAS